MDLGALTAFFYGFRERELILDIFEETCGARMSMNYNTIGGVMADIHPDFQRKVKEFIKIMPARLKEYNQVFTGNVIARNRMIGVGHLSLEDAIRYNATGPTGRASGWACDMRLMTKCNLKKCCRMRAIRMHAIMCVSKKSCSLSIFWNNLSTIFPKAIMPLRPNL